MTKEALSTSTVSSEMGALSSVETDATLTPLDDSMLAPLEEIPRPEFTVEMRENYTILIPDMLPVHWKFLERIFDLNGYHVEILKNEGRSVVDTGLKYVHNDTCYPALLVIGQMIDALKSGRYDTHKVALLITQTGGGCRASNYLPLLRKALVKAGLSYVPVLSLNPLGIEKHGGFSLSLSFLREALASLAYGDLLMLLKNRVRPYERDVGAVDVLLEQWIERLLNEFKSKRGLSIKDVRSNTAAIARDFASLPLVDRKKTRVGIVGEIYIKYASLGNNGLEAFLESQNCEVVVPGLIGFMLYATGNRIHDISLYGGSPVKKMTSTIAVRYLKKVEDTIQRALAPYPQFEAPVIYETLKEYAKPFVGLGTKMGEGWLLTAEMVELLETGVSNIICAQPFGCLPNHIVGKGMIRTLREAYPGANIVPIDYDPSATRINQENRIKLMLAVAQ